MSFNVGEAKYIISVDSSNAVTQLQKFEGQADRTAKKSTESFKTSLASAVSLGAGLFNLYNQYDQLEKIQLRIRKSALEVSRAQEEVNKLAKEGKTGTLDYQQALERLSIAQERYRILSQDLKQAQVGLAFSFAQTALTIPSAINAIKGLTSASSILNVVTSKWTLIALAAIAAYEGLAQVIKHVTGHDYTLTTATKNLTDKILGQNQVLREGSEGFQAYGESIAGVNTEAVKTSKSIGDLNAEMERSIGKLKKNKDELKETQQEIASSIFLMGSLSHIVTELESRGAFEKVRELQKDLRTVTGLTPTQLTSNLPTSFSNLERNISFSNLSPAHREIFSNASENIQKIIRSFRPFGNSLNTAFTSVLRSYPGIPQAQAKNLVGGGMATSTTSRSTGGARRARRGKRIDPRDTVYAVLAPEESRNVLVANQVGYERYLNIVDELAEFGLSAPSPTTQFWVPMMRAPLSVPNPNFLQELNKAIGDMQRIKAERERARIQAATARATAAGISYAELINLENSGRAAEIEHLTEYRRRLEAMSSGTV